MLLAGHVLRGAAPAARTYFAWLLVGFAAIFGHMFSLFLGFKGGKGVATSSGVILGLFPYFTIPGIVALAVWGVVLKGTGYISVASIVAAVLFPVTYVLLALVSGWPLLGEQLPLLVFSVLVAAMIVYKHRSNIARLRAGTEPRYDAPRAAPAGEARSGDAADAPRPASAA
jgi:glycerol-3-phosphate acyltransferase PlsY